MQFSVIAAQHIQSRQNAGKLADATHVGVGGSPGGGPYVQLWVRLEGAEVRAATYECNGCPSSIAAASMAAAILKGRTVEQALRITDSDLLLLLGGLPEGKEYYTELAAAAIHDALKDAYPTQFKEYNL